jgi:hypothetical protein
MAFEGRGRVPMLRRDGGEMVMQYVERCFSEALRYNVMVRGLGEGLLVWIGLGDRCWCLRGSRMRFGTATWLFLKIAIGRAMVC